MPVSRFDYLGATNSFEKTSQGFLRVKANLTRTGIFLYTDGSQTVRELRSPEEVFCADSLKSLKGAPVTDLHPSEKGATPFVTADNAQQVSVGIAEELAENGQFLTGTLLIFDAKAIEAIESGKRKEISLGYKCDLEPMPGVFQGQRYDAIQKNIVVNHIALGPAGWGRAGPECSIRLDSNTAYQILEENNLSEHKQVMNLDGIDIELSPQSVKTLLDAKKSELENLRGKLDAISAELTKEKKMRMDAENPARIEEKLNSRLKLIKQSESVLGGDFRFDSKSERGIKEAVITALHPTMEITGKDESYIDGVFEATLSNKSMRNDSLGNAHVAAKMAGSVQKLDARDNWLRDSAELYKKPLAGSLNRGIA